jgi:hypothetical protein
MIKGASDFSKKYLKFLSTANLATFFVQTAASSLSEQLRQ